MKPHIPLPEAIYALVAESPGSVLLETSRFDAENRNSYLFLNPLRILTANSPTELASLFEQIEEALAENLFLAGFLSYEAGYVLQNLPSTHAPSDTPLAWFGVFTQPTVFDHTLGSFTGPSLPTLPPPPQALQRAFSPSDVALTLTPEHFAQKIHQIKDHIAAGATYQVNLTDRIHLSTTASPAELYLALSRQQPVAYSALLNTGSQQILSLSPELFFRIKDRRIITRPMKGTWPRGRDAAEDALAALELQNDEKNRSEHLMIVDLLRNDLGRICTTGSIRVDNLFSIERYPTLLQMTSTVSGTLPAKLAWIHIFRSLFPSGSITGAPKLSTIGIIRELEDTPRGVYTGAIGFIAPTGDATFNVAIRTLVHKSGRLTMGVGGGIVIDSDPATEYAECRLKAAFLTRPQPHQLIETMRWETTFVRLALHMERLQHSCDYFGFPFDPALICTRLEELAATFTPLTRHRVRLTLDHRGSVTLSSKPLLPTGDTCRVTLSGERTSSTDAFLRHKTTHRALYDRALAAAQADGFDDVLFLNERGEVTEGAISNLFVRRGGKLYTPPLTCGVLPGVFRRHLLEVVASAEERILTLEDLRNAEELYLCSSLRGLRKITHLDTSSHPDISKVS